jgi:hypothetical protein
MSRVFSEIEFLVHSGAGNWEAATSMFRACLHSEEIYEQVIATLSPYIVVAVRRDKYARYWTLTITR